MRQVSPTVQGGPGPALCPRGAWAAEHEVHKRVHGLGSGQPLSGSAWPQWVSTPGPAQRGSQGPPPIGRQSGAGGQSAWCPAHTSVSRMTPGAQLHTGRKYGRPVCLSRGPHPQVVDRQELGC